MPKKEGKLQQLGNVLSQSLRFVLEGGLERIKESIHRTERKLVHTIYAAATMLAGLLFVAVGIALLLPELFNISIGVGFLIVGLVLTIIALLHKSYIHKTYD